MKDLSLHVLDVLENSARAGAGEVVIELTQRGSVLGLRLRDDGPGFPEEVRDDPADPFRTTRRDRGAGLGLAFLREAAERSGGAFSASSLPGNGVTVRATFDLHHIDAKPIGDLAEALLAALAAWPALNLRLRLAGRDVFDSRIVRDEAGGLPLAHPKLQRWMREQLDRELAPWHRWAETAAGAAAREWGKAVSQEGSHEKPR